jgi:hypothetical protein
MIIIGVQRGVSMARDIDILRGFYMACIMGV